MLAKFNCIFVDRFAVLLTFALAVPFVTSIRVTCNFQRGNLGSDLSNAYICDVPSLDVQSFGVAIDGIDGSHLAGHSNVNVTALRIQSQTCHYVPTGFGNFFPNLEGLTISSSRLRRISRTDLLPFPNLLSLNLDYNRLSVLEEGLFNGVPLLNKASFYNNRLRAIPASLLDPVLSFGSIDLYYNVCVYAEGPTPNVNPNTNMKMREVMKNCQNFPTFESPSFMEIESLKKDVEELKEKLLKIQPSLP